MTKEEIKNAWLEDLSKEYDDMAKKKATELHKILVEEQKIKNLKELTGWSPVPSF